MAVAEVLAGAAFSPLAGRNVAFLLKKSSGWVGQSCGWFCHDHSLWFQGDIPVLGFAHSLCYLSGAAGVGSGAADAAGVGSDAVDTAGNGIGSDAAELGVVGHDTADRDGGQGDGGYGVDLVQDSRIPVLSFL